MIETTGRKRIVIALGGNAITPPGKPGTPVEQWANVRRTCQGLLQILRDEHRIVLTHGNGPQVGNLLIQQETAVDQVPALPLDVCGAMTQGQIGFMIQQGLTNALRDVGLDRPVVTVITRVLVAADDPGFKNPSKPVGPFYSRTDKARHEATSGAMFKRVQGKGPHPYRRVVPSPEPLRILEGPAIKRLVDLKMVVIAAGGGGIPVILGSTEDHTGVEAVIDKDLVSEKLAEAVSADILMILTDTDRVALHYGTKAQQDLETVTVTELEGHYREGHFPPGTMGPKVLACLRFLRFGGERAIIGPLAAAYEALQGEAGTQILPEEAMR
ncbi:MAG: carbamate kinase [Candidatus Methylomirabilales bacterium]